jgi:hypothetical protein
MPKDVIKVTIPYRKRMLKCALIERMAQQLVADGIAIGPRPVHCMLRVWV